MDSQPERTVPTPEDLAQKVSQLRPTTTKVTFVDGSQVLETSTGTAAPAGERTSQESATSSQPLGFIVDHALNDFKLGNPIRGLYFGSLEAAENRDLLRAHGISHILNVAMYAPNAFVEDTTLTYKYLPILDDPQQDIQQHFETTNDFISEALASNDGTGSVLVHCMMGISRSATVAIAYMIKEHKITVEAAVERIRETRWVHPNYGFRRQLEEYYKTLYNWLFQCLPAP